MPGILPRSEGTSGASKPAKMAVETQSEAVAVSGTHVTEGEKFPNGTGLTNGDYKHLNGTLAKGISTTPLEAQAKIPNGIESLAGQLPPEIEHITYGYTPFSLLVSRLVQETFIGLTDVITEISEIAVLPSSQSASSNNLNYYTNGVREGDISDGNVQKKLRMLNFASDRRAQFIKILVLLGWARQAEAVSKVIDLNVWTGWRLQEYKDTISWMGELKRILGPLRDPNPDIKTALEVLSLGKASWLPDLRYLPPESHSPRQLLETLERINTLLAVRLNLHETIPPALRNFSIGSGRAIFSVPDEFEVELSIASEDPSSQLYFVDFRFLFSPTPSELPPGGLREVVQNRSNELLMREGLHGLFDFLHNLTLTHKLGVLRNQAFALLREYSSEHLRVEAVRRSIVVQYWSNRPGGRNWIEIGLKRGKEITTPFASSSQRIPHVGLRWFRAAKEVPNVQLNLELGNLSLEKVLRQVLALHANYVFEHIVVKLRASLLYSCGSLRLKCSSSAREPMDASLLIQLTTSKAVKVIQEPVSGRFSILPASQLNSRAENALNRAASPAIEGASHMGSLRSLTSQEEIESSTRGIGWELVRSMNPNQETMDRVFAKGVQNKKFFRRPSWNTKWLLAFTTSLDGDHWWIVELTESERSNDYGASSSVAGPTLRSAYKVALAGPRSYVMEPSYAKLADIENIAACMISQFVDSRALLSSENPHKVQNLRQTPARIRLGSIFIRFSQKRSSLTIPPGSTIGHSWLEEVVRLDYCGLDSSKSQVIHIAHVHMQHSIPEIQNVLSSIPSIAFEPVSEGFPAAVKFQLITKIGETVIPNLRCRLQAIRLLLDFASTLHSHGLTCSTASLTHLAFNYATSARPLTATIHIPEKAPRHISLSRLNPHLRIVDHLSERIRSNGLSSVIAILRVTLTLLQTFSNIEAGQSNAGFNVLTRSDQWYQVRYSEPYPKSSFDIRLRNRRDDAMWCIPETSIKKPESADESFEHDLRAIMKGRGEGWRGVNGGAIAHLNGVEDLITKLDAIFRVSKHVPGASNPKKRKAPEEVVELD